MLLLPDIDIILVNEAHKISIQDPFTLNGELITKICIETDEPEYANVTDGLGATLRSFIIRSPQKWITFTNKEDFCLKIEYERLAYGFQYEMRNFIREHGRDATRIGDNTRRYIFNDLKDFKIDDYIALICKQCENILHSRTELDRNTGDYYRECYDRLRIQNRLRDDSRIISTNAILDTLISSVSAATESISTLSSRISDLDTPSDISSYCTISINDDDSSGAISYTDSAPQRVF